MTVLGTDDPDLYDWAGGGGEADEGPGLVDSARAGYREVVRALRAQVFSLAPDSALPAQSRLSRDLNADVAVINRAAAQLSAEGLVRVEHGRVTVTLARSPWVTGFAARLPAEHGDALVTARRLLAAVSADQPAVSAPLVVQAGTVLHMTMTVQSADAAGAFVAALDIARRVFAAYPIVGIYGGEDDAPEARPADGDQG